MRKHANEISVLLLVGIFRKTIFINSFKLLISVIWDSRYGWLNLVLSRFFTGHSPEVPVSRYVPILILRKIIFLFEISKIVEIIVEVNNICIYG